MVSHTTAHRVSTGNQEVHCPYPLQPSVYHVIQWNVEIIGSYSQEILPTVRPLGWPFARVFLWHLCLILAQNKIRFFPHWRNACPGQVSTTRG